MKHKYLENVTTLKFNAEKCVGCERCTEVCPHGVFDIIDDKTCIIDKNSCMECGACVMNCPAEAIEVNAGVGCAAAIIQGWFTGKEPTCGCSEDGGDNNGKCC
jgi:NAD-dependent dihydropyrimidine dehydrogenase PreA subunit